MRKVIAREDVMFTDFKIGDEFDLYSLDEAIQKADDEERTNILGDMNIQSGANSKIVGWTIDSDGDFIHVYDHEIEQ